MVGGGKWPVDHVWVLFRHSQMLQVILATIQRSHTFSQSKLRQRLSRNFFVVATGIIVTFEIGEERSCSLNKLDDVLAGHRSQSASPERIR